MTYISKQNLSRILNYQSSSASFTLDWEGDGMSQAYWVGPKRPGGRLTGMERKKGVPWTEEEHKTKLGHGWLSGKYSQPLQESEEMKSSSKTPSDLELNIQRRPTPTPGRPQSASDRSSLAYI